MNVLIVVLSHILGQPARTTRARAGHLSRFGGSATETSARYGSRAGAERIDDPERGQFVAGDERAREEARQVEAVRPDCLEIADVVEVAVDDRSVVLARRQEHGRPALNRK
jgi:hypothetical protein